MRILAVSIGFATRGHVPFASTFATFFTRAADQIRVAVAVAAAICLVSSFALGVVPGFLHLLAVVSAYSYDLALKSTMVSWLPFAVSFGVLPAVVSTAATDRPGPGLLHIHHDLRRNRRRR